MSVNIQLFHPSSQFIFYWENILCLLIILCTFLLSIGVAQLERFSATYPLQYYYFIKFAQIYLLANVLVSLNTSVTSEGKLLIDRQQIVKKYIKKQIFTDSLPILSLFAEEFNLPIYFDLLILIKLITLKKIFRSREDASASNQKSNFPYFLKLLGLFLQIWLIGHTFACFFVYISTVQQAYGIENNWLTIYKPNTEIDWYEKYLYAFYYCVTTMTTVGYGDITPKTVLEIVFGIISLITLCGVYAYSFNYIGIIVQDMNKRKEEFKQNMTQLNYYMHKLNINVDLKYKIRTFYEYQQAQTEDITLEEEQSILNKLSPDLRNQLILDANKQILKKCGSIFQGFSAEFIDCICLLLNKVKLQKDQILFKPNELEQDPCFFYIEEGEIELFLYENHKSDHKLDSEGQINKIEEEKEEGTEERKVLKIIKKIKANEYFGERGFFLNQPRSLGARSATFSKCHVIQRSQFMQAIKAFPKDFEYFCMIRDQMNLGTKYLDLKCFSCNREGHFINQCHLLHSTYDKQKVFLQNNYWNQKSERIKIERKQKTKIRWDLNQIQANIKEESEGEEDEDEESKEDLIKLNNEENKQNNEVDDDIFSIFQKNQNNNEVKSTEVLEDDIIINNIYIHENNNENNLKTKTNIAFQDFNYNAHLEKSNQLQHALNFHNINLQQRNKRSYLPIKINHQQEKKSGFKNLKMKQKISDNNSICNSLDSSFCQLSNQNNQLNNNNNEIMNLFNILVEQIKCKMIQSQNADQAMKSYKNSPFIFDGKILNENKKQEQIKKSKTKSEEICNSIGAKNLIFETRQDYKYYFPSFNLRNILIKFNQEKKKIIFDKDFGKYTYFNRFKKNKLQAQQ